MKPSGLESVRDDSAGMDSPHQRRSPSTKLGAIRYSLNKLPDSGQRRELLRVYPVTEKTLQAPNDYDSGQDFLFDSILREGTTQEEVFDVVAKPVLSSFVNGVNGCILCYGQTSAGKTYTACGSDTYGSRGLMQRCIESVFSTETVCQQNKIYLSFFEIYNDNVYDLLAKDLNTQKPIESWPRVAPQEDDCGILHLGNLSLHAVSTVSEALDVFMYGNFNRMVCSTPMNEISSRSHCVFTIHVESWASNGIVSQKRRRSSVNDVITTKLHIVDLAGSERIWKSNLSPKNITEAKHINRSLHFLEQVIGSLAQKPSHIPYRNSMLTSVLRDSLGGHCKTVLVANLSSDATNYKETIATCRFAQRCARVAVVDNGTSSCSPNSKHRCLDAMPLRSTFSAAVSPEVILQTIGPTVRELMSKCGSDLGLFPKETRKALLERIRQLGLEFRVNCVGDLCALVQVLLAKLTLCDREKTTLVEKPPQSGKRYIPPESNDLYTIRQWQQALASARDTERGTAR